jgi:hypothetical protein
MSAAKEALRQQMLLRALWRDARPGVLAGWTRDGARFARGLQVYQANAGAVAERALAAAYPTVQQVIGAEHFAGLARALWQRDPPQRGDVAHWGGGLGDFLERAIEQASHEARRRGESGPDEPYLPDLARLEWAVHVAHTAHDADGPVVGLDRLAGADIARLRLRARAGTQVLRSAHPVVSVWRAHRAPEGIGQAPGGDREATLRARLQQALLGAGAEPALVWRAGWRVEVAALGLADAAFTLALLQGLPLAAALAATEAPASAAAADKRPFDFEAWLVAALNRGWLASVEPAAEGPTAGPGSR